jgi:hypothetical protein
MDGIITRNFENVYIGFFLVAHGWYANVMNSYVADKYMICSTVDFAQKYKPTGYDIVDNKIYSVYVKGYSESGDEMLLVGFEDSVANGGGDLDYNDAVIGFRISDVNNIVDYDKYSKIVVKTPPEPKNNIINYDDNGEYIIFDKNKYNLLPGIDYVFERHLTFNNQIDRDQYFTILNTLRDNYKYGKSIVNDNGTYKIIIKHLFRKNDIASSKKNNSHIFYLFQLKFNTRQIIADYEKMVNEGIVNGKYTERYRLYELQTLKEIIKLTDTFDRPSKIIDNDGKTDGNFRIIGDGIVDCVNGRARIPFDVAGNYLIYKNINYDSSGFVINIRMDTHPDNFMAGKKNFLSMVSFIVNNGNVNENIVVDLRNLKLFSYDSNNNPIEMKNIEQINSEYKTISVSDVKSGNSTIKDLVAIFSNNSNSRYRTIKINNTMTFYCIRFANVKNNPTMVFMNNQDILSWASKYNSVSGTYFIKQRIYPIDSIVNY